MRLSGSSSVCRTLLILTLLVSLAPALRGGIEKRHKLCTPCPGTEVESVSLTPFPAYSWVVNVGTGILPDCGDDDCSHNCDCNSPEPTAVYEVSLVGSNNPVPVVASDSVTAVHPKLLPTLLPPPLGNRQPRHTDLSSVIILT